MKLKLMYEDFEVTVKPFTGRVIKALSGTNQTIAGMVNLITENLPTDIDLTVIDAMRILRTAWVLTNEDETLPYKVYCPKCGTLNQLYMDMSMSKTNSFKTPNIYGEIDFYGQPITISPLRISVYSGKPDNLDVLNSMCSIEVLDLTLPKIKALSDLFNEETEILTELTTAKCKCCNEDCDAEVTKELNISENFILG